MLLTKKKSDFILFKQAVEIMNKKGHLSIEGLNQIISIKASMNLGLSDIINSKNDFDKIIPVSRPLVVIDDINDPNWVAGFFTGEGCFDVKITKSISHKIGSQIQLRFRIYQHERDIKLMEQLIKFLGSGKIEKDTRKPLVSLTIIKFSDISNIIIPFFEKYSVKGEKYFNYLDWCKIAKLMKEKSHLTIQGVDLIRDIKSGMNKGR